MIAFLGALAIAASLKGVVVDFTGAALPRANIRVLEAESNILVARATAEEKGAFKIDPLKPGAYTVTAWGSGFRLRIQTGVLIREGEAVDLGKLRLDFAGCDAPGVICDTVNNAPVFPGLIRRASLAVPLNCGTDLVKGKSSCPTDSEANFTVKKDGIKVDLLPLNGATLDARCSGQSDAKIRVDGFGPGLDFCVHLRDGLESHVYVVNEVGADSTEVRISLTTTKRR
ncbi:MAG TPA: carboxypeptidase-like regulatory domain-containing protein [Bryobacteraceae bacterium]|nr:carboxypeptidase-like regulatory domain-containing protein [Bryobacteraceae bacterium]